MAENPHRSLRAAALDLIDRALHTTVRVPARTRHVEDQLLRAATSIAVNIAEGASEWAPGDKARFYRIARRSAAEAGAAFDVLARHGVAAQEAANEANQAIDHLRKADTNDPRRRTPARRQAVRSPGTSPGNQPRARGSLRRTLPCPRSTIS